MSNASIFSHGALFGFLLLSDERDLLWLATPNPSPLNLASCGVLPSQGTPVQITLTLQIVLLVSNYFRTIFLWNLQLAPQQILHLCPSELWKYKPFPRQVLPFCGHRRLPLSLWPRHSLFQTQMRNQ